MILPPIKSFYIDGIRNIKSLKIEFDPNLNIIVGPNGVGKTTVLTTIRDFFSGEYYNFQARLNVPNFTTICQFHEVKLTNEIIKDFNLASNLLVYNFQIPDDIINFIPDLVLELSRFSQPTIQGTKFSLANVQDIIDKNGSFVTYVIKRELNNQNAYSYDPTGIISGFILVDNKMYATPGLNRQEILKRIKNNILDFNLDDNDNFYNKLLSTLQEKEKLKNKFQNFQQEATNTINSLLPTTTQRILYSTTPRMETDVLNNEGKNIKYLSSGERQFERLKLFLSTKLELNPYLLLIDEPELHLNYSQLTYLSDLIKDLKGKNNQVFISSHSSYFLRSFPNKVFSYLRFDKNHNPKYVPLLHAPIKQNLNIYPELFFAEKVIIVEGAADSVFFHRVIDTILKKYNLKDLSSKNIYVLSVSGKSQIKPLVKFINNYLGIKYVIITDTDFILDLNHFNFIDQKTFNLLKEPLLEIQKYDSKKTIKRFRDLNPEQAERFINLVDEIINPQTVTEDKLKEYEQFKTIIKSYVYDSSLLGSLKFNKIHQSLKNENI